MAKVTNIRERVHQPFRDTLIRTSGNYTSNVQDRTDLFTQAGKDAGATNLQNGSTLPSDQSMVVLALRVFLWFRNPVLREYNRGNVIFNGDFDASDLVTGAVPFGANANTAIGRVDDVWRLYFQASEQLLWSFGAGEKYSLTSMPSSYFPYGGGIYGGAHFGNEPEAQVTDAYAGFVALNNGMPTQAAILRLARAVLLPPRQNIKCSAQIVSYADNPTNAVSQQGSRNMLSLTSNFNIADGINKVCSFTFDGLFSRDVQ